VSIWISTIDSSVSHIAEAQAILIINPRALDQAESARQGLERCHNISFEDLLMWELYQDFGVIARMPQCLEHFGHLLDANYIGNHGLRLNFFARQRIDCFVEVHRIVAEYKIHIDLAQNTLHRLNLVGFHAYSDHYHLTARCYHGDSLSQATFDADTLEDEVRIVTGHLAHLIDRILRTRID